MTGTCMEAGEQFPASACVPSSLIDECGALRLERPERVDDVAVMPFRIGVQQRAHAREALVLLWRTGIGFVGFAALKSYDQPVLVWVVAGLIHDHALQARQAAAHLLV